LATNSIVYSAVGKRKRSIARIRLIPGKGNIIVNKREFDSYFGRVSNKIHVREPLKLLDLEKKYDVIANVNGGGLTGQVGALIHGISKALLMFDSELKSTLKKEKLTTRDSRSVERKKYGRKKARKSFQFSKR